MNYPEARTPMSLSSRISPTFVPAQLAALEQWYVRRHLGSGASAHVWLLEEAAGSRRVACKTPRTPEDQTVLSQEAELARSLEHENLVRSFAAGPQSELSLVEGTGGSLWEFLPAGSLESLISAGGALSLAQTVTVLLPMVQVAMYLHSQQIAHGDFSPANIMFDLQGRPVLIDLGDVRATGHAYHTTGTPGFTAPEIHSGQHGVPGLAMSADTYSLAAIGWFCLTGAAPGPPHTRVPLVMLRPELESEIVSVLESCLSAEPSLRLSLSQLLTAIVQWSAPEPVDLFASAGEEYELLLPTRKPLNEGQLGKRKRCRKRASRNDVAETGISNPERPASRRRRLLLGMASGALLAGVMVTTHYVGQGGLEPQALDQVMSKESEDFQAVVDRLAKARSNAWASSDSSHVGAYAAKDSPVFDDDVHVLDSLHEAGMDLDGIRMRAVVEAVDHARQTATVEVEWRIDAYSQRDESSQIIERVDARSERLILHLVDTDDGWRISSVQES